MNKARGFRAVLGIEVTFLRQQYFCRRLAAVSMSSLRTDEIEFNLPSDSARRLQSPLKFAPSHAGESAPDARSLSAHQQKGWTAGVGEPWECRSAESPRFRRERAA